MIINTAGAEFTDWAKAVSQQLGIRGNTVALEEGMEWKEWARRILRLPQIANQFPVSPDYFDDWLTWANAFNQSVEY